jgi:hypothetical protein
VLRDVTPGGFVCVIIRKLDQHIRDLAMSSLSKCMESFGDMESG